jgi:hypothetical protein
VRVACIALVAACSLDHGRPVGSVIDGGSDGGDAPDGPAMKIASPRKLIFDNSASTLDFGAHPVLVALDATTIDYAAVADPLTDLRFEYATAGVTANVGDNVPFDVEQWDPSGESIVWIRVPEILKGTTDTAVLMHFGPTAAGAASAQATWMSWELVNHMQTGLTNAIGMYTPTGVNITFAQGHTGEAAVFSGSGDHRITFTGGGELFDGWSQYYISFWIYPDYTSATDLAGERKVMDKGTSIELGRLYNSNGDIVFQLDQHFTGSNNDFFLNTAIKPRQWTNIAVWFDGNATGIVNNGALAGVGNLSGNNETALQSTSPFYLGHATAPFSGMIDELRIERRTRSLDFVRAQYLNATRKFVTFKDP